MSYPVCSVRFNAGDEDQIERAIQLLRERLEESDQMVSLVAVEP